MSPKLAFALGKGRDVEQTVQWQSHITLLHCDPSLPHLFLASNREYIAANMNT
jgi:hypothetical protein